jgi:16S rRNA (adenine1518-N6/adenine1519-N6)-dimethyltransferase
MLKTEIKNLLREHRIVPKRSLGQNFLVDPSGIELIISGAHITPADDILEIGAGLGSLTRALADLCGRVVAVETDRRLVQVLEQELEPWGNIVLCIDDFLELDFKRLSLKDHYKVVANIPYYITSAILRRLMTETKRPDLIVLTVQSEVADRIIQGPGQMSLLALSVQLFGKPEIIGQIPANSFYPAPKVDSSVLRIVSYADPDFDPGQIDLIFELAKAGFGQKRKMLRNSIGSGLDIGTREAEQLLTEAGLDPGSRAQELSVDDWRLLAVCWHRRFA